MRRIDQLFIVVLLLAAAYFVLRPTPPLGPVPNPAAMPEPAATVKPAATAGPAGSPSQTAAPRPEMPSEPARAAAPPRNVEPAGKKFRLSNPRVENVTIHHRDGQVVFQGTIDLTPTLTRIVRGQRLNLPDDGIVFQNRESRLPAQPAGYYHEYVHPTPQLYGLGPQRVIVGADGEVYYTPDHYRTFKRL